MWARLRRIEFGPEDASPRAQARWALVSVIVVIAMLATVGVLYLRPPGYRTHQVILLEAGGLHGGESVRIAGIPVGRVLAMHLRDEDVEVEFSVKASVRLGDRTAVDVRMLTPIGGLYLALVPEGSTPLRAPIPVTRTRLPFVVTDLVAQAKSTTDRVDTDALRASLSGAAAALSGAPESVRNSVTDLEKVVHLFAIQKQQIEGLLALSGEYLQTVHDNQAITTEVLRAYAALGPRIVESRTKVKTFADSIADLVGLLFEFLSGPYQAKIEPLLPPLEQTRDLAGQLLDRTDQVMASLTTTVTELGQLAGPDGRALVDQSGLTVAQPNVCLPVPGKKC